MNQRSTNGPKIDALHAEGLSNAEIAKRLGLSVSRVANQIQKRRQQRVRKTCRSGDCGECVACRAIAYSGSPAPPDTEAARPEDPTAEEIATRSAAYRNRLDAGHERSGFARDGHRSDAVSQPSIREYRVSDLLGGAA